jgi:hypothetical protein
MIYQMAAARVGMRAMGLVLVVIATSGCDSEPPQSYARCERGEAVYYRGDGTEILRFDCAADEQCVEFSPKQAVCRLFETCDAPSSFRDECRGDALFTCNLGEQFRERIDCVTDNHGKVVPGRCAPDTLSGPDCVDRDAVRCDFSFKESCNGNERQACLNGYTSQMDICSQPDIEQGGTCRLNADARAVCAQPDAPTCSHDDYWGQCDEDAIVTCRGGFVFRQRCPEGKPCRMDLRGDVYEALCGSA